MSGAIFSEPFLSELTGLDIVEGALHIIFDVLVDDSRTGEVVAELGSIGDGEAHFIEAALVDEVDD